MERYESASAQGLARGLPQDTDTSQDVAESPILCGNRHSFFWALIFFPSALYNIHNETMHLHELWFLRLGLPTS